MRQATYTINHTDSNGKVNSIKELTYNKMKETVKCLTDNKTFSSHFLDVPKGTINTFTVSLQKLTLRTV